MLYNLFISLFGIAIRIHALFNSKSKDWIEGRKNWKSKLAALNFGDEKVAWFHVASLGEFEQSLPIMQELKTEFKIVVTFFSPSGYRYRQNHELPDQVLYMPLDTQENAKAMVEAIRPKVLVVNKYDLWFNHLNEAKKFGTKLVLVAANFREDHHYFKWYGGFGRSLLRLFDSIVVQNEASKKRLNSIGIDSKISGDTRYDRVLSHAEVATIPEHVQKFVEGSRVAVFGSSWPVSEKMLAGFIDQFPEDVKVILAPHDIGDAHLKSVMGLFPQAIRYSRMDQYSDEKILVIDNIGMLSSLYKVADVAYIGGAFGSGLHNILEAMAFGVPVVFGPKTEKFPEAAEAIQAQVARQVSSAEELHSALEQMLNADKEAERIKVVDYMNSKAGATEISVKAIHEALGITQH